MCLVEATTPSYSLFTTVTTTDHKNWQCLGILTKQSTHLKATVQRLAVALICTYGIELTVFLGPMPLPDLPTESLMIVNEARVLIWRETTVRLKYLILKSSTKMCRLEHSQ